MDSEVTFYTDEGSSEAQSALTALARTLNINESALKTVLNGAFDLLPTTAESPMLALQLSFMRLSYRLDIEALYETMSAFRQAFGAAFSTQRVHHTTTQTLYKQYHEALWAPLTNAQPGRNTFMGPSEYPTLAFRSMEEPIHYQHIQVGPPPWYLDCTGKAFSSGSQPIVTAVDNRAPALRDLPALWNIFSR